MAELALQLSILDIQIDPTIFCVNEPIEAKIRTQRASPVSSETSGSKQYQENWYHPRLEEQSSRTI